MGSLTELMSLMTGDSRVNSKGAVCEVYSPPRVVKMARAHGFKEGWSLDLTTCDDQGRPWDFDDMGCRQRAKELIRKTKPLLLIGSPMCSWFSSLMQWNFSKMPAKKVEENLRRALSHLSFVFELYGLQAGEGRYVAHEHPAAAISWKAECVVKLAAKYPDVQIITNYVPARHDPGSS